MPTTTDVYLWVPNLIGTQHQMLAALANLTPRALPFCTGYIRAICLGVFVQFEHTVPDTLAQNTK